jgi:cytochrome c556
MRRRAWFVGVAILIGAAARAVQAHEAPDLPAGPIRDRHELMEGQAKNAKVINDALKAHALGPDSVIGPAALEIQTSAAKITSLFPPGSTSPKSRAKPNIWTNWKKFEEDAKDLEARAGVLANAVLAGGNIPVEAKQMFAACKACHDEFRKPEKKKK